MPAITKALLEDLPMVQTDWCFLPGVQPPRVQDATCAELLVSVEDGHDVFGQLLGPIMIQRRGLEDLLITSVDVRVEHNVPFHPIVLDSNPKGAALKVIAKDPTSITTKWDGPILKCHVNRGVASVSSVRIAFRGWPMRWMWSINDRNVTSSGACGVSPSSDLGDSAPIVVGISSWSGTAVEGAPVSYNRNLWGEWSIFSA